MEEVSKCKTCGEYDTTRHTSDCGYCTECYAVEDYTSVLVDDNWNEIPEPKITETEIDEMGEHYGEK